MLRIDEVGQINDHVFGFLVGEKIHFGRSPSERADANHQKFPNFHQKLAFVEMIDDVSKKKGGFFTNLSDKPSNGWSVLTYPGRTEEKFLKLKWE